MAIEQAKNSLTGGKGKRWSPLDNMGESPLMNTDGKKGVPARKTMLTNKKTGERVSMEDIQAKRRANKAKLAELKKQKGSPAKNTGGKDKADEKQQSRYVKKGTGVGTGKKAETTSDSSQSKYAARRLAAKKAQSAKLRKT